MRRRNNPASIERRKHMRVVSVTRVTRYECINGNGTPYLIEHTIRADGSESWDVLGYRYDRHIGASRMQIVNEECKRPILKSLRTVLESHKQEIEKMDSHGA